MSDSPRRTRRPIRIAGDVTRASGEAWKEFSAVHGISKAALLEVLGPYLATHAVRPPRWLAGLIVEARTVDADRKRRQ